jgi:hypothetical protein
MKRLAMLPERVAKPKPTRNRVAIAKRSRGRRGGGLMCYVGGIAEDYRRVGIYWSDSLQIGDGDGHNSASRAATLRTKAPERTRQQLS